MIVNVIRCLPGGLTVTALRTRTKLLVVSACAVFVLIVGGVAVALLNSDPFDPVGRPGDDRGRGAAPPPAGKARPAGGFDVGRTVGRLDDKRLKEVSGMAASRRYPGMFWVHNDKGDQPRIFLIDGQGRHRATVELPGVDNRDWEEIAVGPGPEAGTSYLYVGDIGDNDAEYDTLSIHRLPEPTLDLGGGPAETVADGPIDTLAYRYSDGRRDAETLLVDPATRDLYVISKREPDRVNLYRLAYPQQTGQVGVAQHVTAIPFTEIVSGDIAPDGRSVLIKNYDNVYFWRIGADESLADVFARAPDQPPYQPEEQGEAIAFTHDGSAFLTVSEGRESPLIRYDAVS